MKRPFSLLLALCLLLTLPVSAEAPLSLDSLMLEIEEEVKELSVDAVSFEISEDGQSIYIDRPAVTGPEEYTIAYNIYDADSNPVNYFYSLEERVAATPGYGGLFNVFVVVTDTATGEQDIQNIGWQTLLWPLADSLEVGRATYEVSPDRQSVFVDRPAIACASGSVTIAYNIYDANSNPVNYFYSTQKRVAATPGYDGRFNVFVVVTDTGTGEQDVQDIGWQTLGDPVPPVQEDDPSDYDYRAFGDYVVIYGYHGSGVDIVIPSYIEGQPVREIGDHAFAGNEKLTGHVTLPSTLEIIGWEAFNGSSLTGVTLNEGLKVIDHSAFSFCEHLAGHLAFPSTLEKIDNNAFDCCVGLTGLTFNEGLKSIGQCAFNWCWDLSGHLTFPSSFEEIGDYAFNECVSLTGLTFNEGLMRIGAYAFLDCQGLTGTVTIPQGCDVGEGAFDLTEVNVVYKN